MNTEGTELLTPGRLNGTLNTWQNELITYQVEQNTEHMVEGTEQ